MRSRMVHLASALAVLVLLVIAMVGVLTADPAPPDRAYGLELQLRCPVCKSVSVAESGSETAVAMRAEVARQIAAGRADAQIVDYFRARYGDWVLLDPPLAGTTAAVWLIPAAGAALAVLVLLTRARRSADPVPDVPQPVREKVLAEVERVRRQSREDEP